MSREWHLKRDRRCRELLRSGAYRSQNAANLIWNLVVEIGLAIEVKPEQALQVIEEGKVNTGAAIWRQYAHPHLINFIELTIEDNEVPNPQQEWNAFATLFGFKETDVDNIADPMLHDVFQKWWSEIIDKRDGKIGYHKDDEVFEIDDDISKQNDAMLKRYDKNKNFDDDDQEKARKVFSDKEWEKFSDNLNETNRLDPEKLASLKKKIYEDLDVEWRFNSEDIEYMEQCERAFRLESLPLEPINVSINLPRGEIAYFQCEAIRIEEKKGALYEVENGDGDLYVTNKHLIFIADSVISLPWGKILKIEEDDSLYIFKNSGKPVILDTMNITEIDSVIILYNRMLKENF